MSAEPSAGPDPEPITFEELIAASRPKVRRVFAHYRIPHQDAEDLLQEALIVTLRRWSEIRHKEGWLVVTLRYKCSIYWREKQTSRMQAVDPPFLEVLSEAVPPEQERAEMHWDLDSLFACLEERHSALLRLRYLHGYSTAECAEILGYNVSSVRKLCGRAVAKMLRRLDEGRFPADGEEAEEALGAE
ncbi:MAG TPA: sigma-70 family RNA polymerase sigma factor [Thermoanaerobaculia bacterium]|jgi:RNA polymerase sigma factor (sigma-70 family)|nr:sigma-70 family RNA polymerase sigma factor [Thermoanaerobaculia bacterium]